MALTPDPAHCHQWAAGSPRRAGNTTQGRPSGLATGHPALDLVRGRPPKLRSLEALPSVEPGPDGYIDAITAAVTDLDNSYLAVQGPPGSGKTHVGAHVLARLIANGWKVGVVAQSRAVVENMLCAMRGRMIRSGLPRK